MRLRRNKCILVFSALTLALPVLNAAIDGFPSLNDRRIQHMNYVNDQVYNLYAKVGYATLVELNEDETIASKAGQPSVFVGNKSFDFSVFKNKFVFKPLLAVSTDLIVVTDKRTYVFHISPANKHKVPTYHYSFKQNSGLNHLTITQPRMNFNYFGRGDRQLKPKKAWDDGKFTYFDFSNLSELPLVFLIDESGEENQVDKHITNKIMVIHTVAKRFYVRRDKLVLEIFKNQVMTK